MPPPKKDDLKQADRDRPPPVTEHEAGDKPSPDDFGKEPPGARSAGESDEAARLSREDARNPWASQAGRSLLACFEPQAIGKALGVHHRDAERLLEGVLAAPPDGSTAEDRAVELVRALYRVADGGGTEAIDQVLRDRADRTRRAQR